MVLVFVILASLAGTADVAGLVDVPLIPTRDGRTEQAGWSEPAVPAAPSASSVGEVLPAAETQSASPGERSAAGPSGADPEVDPARGLVLSGAGSSTLFYVDNSHPNASDANAGTSESAP